MRAFLIAVSALAVAACGMSANAQNAGHGGKERRSYNVDAFHSISLGGSPDVVVRVGPAASAYAEGSGTALDELEVTVEHGDLQIRPRNRNFWRWGNQGHVTVYVTTPQLDAASIGGSGNMRIDHVRGDRFHGSIGGSGDLQIDSLAVRDANLAVAGSGNIHAAGSAERQNLSIAGSGDIETGALNGRSATVSVMGSGNVRARATENASVTVMGSGDVELAGGAQCHISKAGSGSVRCTA